MWNGRNLNLTKAEILPDKYNRQKEGQEILESLQNNYCNYEPCTLSQEKARKFIMEVRVSEKVVGPIVLVS